MQRRIPACPSARPGVAKGTGQNGQKGDHPVCTSERSEARKMGEVGRAGAASALPLPGTRGWPLRNTDFDKAALLAVKWFDYLVARHLPTSLMA